MREDYSADGEAWNHFTHELARSRAYRWGEDAIGGFSDANQRWCLGVSLWNGRDRILKERLFGLTNGEGNHGEDVKEHYWHLDALPSHAYMAMLYRYPQAAYPYEQLVAENARRGYADREYEIEDTGILAEDRVFDVTVEYAKALPDDILMRVTVENRGPTAEKVWLIPQFWGRNTWSWVAGRSRAQIRSGTGGSLLATRPRMMPLALDCDGADEIVFCENDTNLPRLYGLAAPGPFKDGFHDYVVGGDAAAISRDGGSKCAFVRQNVLAPASASPCGCASVPRKWRCDRFRRFRRAFRAPHRRDGRVLRRGAGGHRRRRAGPGATARLCRTHLDQAVLSRRHAEMGRRRSGDAAPPPRVRNLDWEHVNNADIISMPDKWEYPWYAAWDLAFHALAFLAVDPAFAKDQLVLLTRGWYMHPNGQLPAYEWNFGDVNPPVHAWAAWRVYEAGRIADGKGDRAFLEGMFHKLLINFTWWINRKDADGRNIFQGGFLGLDNIGLFDRSKPLPTGGSLDQSDGTAWMAMYALTMLRIALELAAENPVYQDLATKFFEHFLTIAGAMTDVGGAGIGLWNEEDGFFYDVLKFPDGRKHSMRIRSIVGLIPIFAVEVLGPDVFNGHPEFAERARWFLDSRRDLAALISRWTEEGVGKRHLLSLLRGHRLKQLLKRALDEDEFLSPYGIRALSKAHAAEPFVLEADGARFELRYAPGESVDGSFGGNSNWRGPVWLPINYMLIDSLRRFHAYYGDEFRVECPTRSGTMLSLAEIADEIARRLQRLFLKDADGVRPAQPERQTPLPDGSDGLLFHEYFDGDTGRGLGASHQTGWTALIAMLIGERYPGPKVEPAQADPALTER